MTVRTHFRRTHLPVGEDPEGIAKARMLDVARQLNSFANLGAAGTGVGPFQSLDRYGRGFGAARRRSGALSRAGLPPGGRARQRRVARRIGRPGV